MRTRYCQRCRKVQVLRDNAPARPCDECGGTNFDVSPPSYLQRLAAFSAPFEKRAAAYTLTPEDRDFLRCNRIDPQED